MTIAKRILGKAELSGQEMIKALREAHPFYSDGKQAKKLLKEMGVKREKLLG